MENNEKMDLSSRVKELRDELWIIVPFFLLSLVFFLGSFHYKRGAGYVPMAVGGAMAIMTGMRLYHIIFPASKIGEFKEAGLAGEFDHIKEEIETETLKGQYEEPKGKEVTFADEKKGFIGIIGCFIVYFLFGYIVASFLVIVGGCYYYGYKDKLPIALTLVSLFIIVYVVLYKMLGAPADFGMLLKPILKSLDLI